MKKLNEYPIVENNTSSVKEPEVTYKTSYPYMSRAEALKHGMPLEESKRLILERINFPIDRQIETSIRRYASRLSPLTSLIYLL